MNASQEDGEVADVDEVFLLKVNLELIFGQTTGGEMTSCPMVFAIHDFEQCVEKAGLCQS